MARLSTSGKSHLDHARAKYAATSHCEHGEDCEATVWGTSFASGKAKDNCVPKKVYDLTAALTCTSSYGKSLIPVYYCGMAGYEYTKHCLEAGKLE